MLLGKYKASRDNFENLHKLRVKSQNVPSKLDSTVGDMKPLVDPNFHILGEEVFEEFSGKKMELK